MRSLIFPTLGTMLSRPLPHVGRSARPLCSEPHGVEQALAAVQQRLAAATGAGAMLPRLVAVSKTKPVEALREAYDAGVRDFGENYAQELVGKAPEMPVDVRWRFIGKLQSNKCKLVVGGVPNLACVETVDSLKLAKKLDAAAGACTPPRSAPLDILLQALLKVDTSPWEGTKNGLTVAEVPDLAASVVAQCAHLRVAGLMTIGAPGDESCFETLFACRQAVAAKLGLEPGALELSMGMSGDFEAAVRRGSTSVRVGSAIFGSRDYSQKQPAEG